MRATSVSHLYSCHILKSVFLGQHVAALVVIILRSSGSNRYLERCSASRVGMSDNNPHLWRIMLCVHGAKCRRHARGVCGFAHGLDELLPPREYDTLYTNCWRDGVDRWYFQQMSAEQLKRIQEVYKVTMPHMRPPWSKGLATYYGGLPLDSFPDCGWDFGIWQDLLRVPDV